MNTQKGSLALFVLLFFATTHLFAQSSDKNSQPGWREYEKGKDAFEKGNQKKANKYYDEACDKGCNEACKALWNLWYASDYQRHEAKRKCAERGDSDCMYEYANYLIGGDTKVALEWLGKAAKAGNIAAINDLGEFYGNKKYATYDSLKAVEFLQSYAGKGDTSSLVKLLLLQKNDKEALFKVGMAYKARYLKSPSTYALFDGIDLFKQSCELGKAEACYQAGTMHFYITNNYGGHEGGYYARSYFKKAVSLGYKVPADDIARVEEHIKEEDGAAKYSNNKSKIGITPETSKTTNTTTPATAVTKKTCPVCNGTGKVYDTYTTEKRDWNNKTITMTDHKTSRTCSRCNGNGYYTY